MRLAPLVPMLALLAAIACSSPSDPAVPDPTGDRSPADGSTVTGPDVDFTWDAVSGATKYYHQVSSSESMQNPLETTTTSPSLTIDMGTAGTWWWRVRASVSGQHSYTAWTPVWSFTLD